MEEQINWIIERNIQDSADGVAFNNDKSAKEIADTFKRFIEWCMWYSNVEFGNFDDQIVYFLEGDEYTLDELFKYWSEVIDKKKN